MTRRFFDVSVAGRQTLPIVQLATPYPASYAE